MEQFLLSLIRADFEKPNEIYLDAKDWAKLIELSRKTRIFPLVFDCLQDYMSSSIQEEALRTYTENRRRANNQLSILKALEPFAKEHGLRFLPFKGIACSKVIYGDYHTRQSGDIDIAIDPNDTALCDYVLRSQGFFQPDWTMGFRLGSRKQAQVLQFKARQSIPFPVRRKAHDNQLSPYYDAETYTKIEVHDGMYYLSEPLLKEALWLTESLEGTELEAFDPTRTMLCLFLAAYENSENYYACQDGDTNLRDYVDIHFLAKNRGNEIDWEYLERLFREEALSKIATIVCCNYKDVYGYLDKRFAAFVKEDAASRYEASLPSKAFSKELNASLARAQQIDEWRREASNPKIHAVIPYDRTEWIACENPYKLEISCGLALHENGLSISWRFPNVVKRNLHIFGFQAAIVPLFDAQWLEYLVSVSHNSETKPFAIGKQASRPVQRFVANDKGTKIPGKFDEYDDITIESFFIPYDSIGVNESDTNAGFGLIPCVYKRASKTLFQSIRAEENEFLTIAKAVIPNLESKA